MMVSEEMANELPCWRWRRWRRWPTPVRRGALIPHNSRLLRLPRRSGHGRAPTGVGRRRRSDVSTRGDAGPWWPCLLCG